MSSRKSRKHLKQTLRIRQLKKESTPSTKTKGTTLLYINTTVTTFRLAFARVEVTAVVSSVVSSKSTVSKYPFASTSSTCPNKFTPATPLVLNSFILFSRHRDIHSSSEASLPDSPNEVAGAARRVLPPARRSRFEAS